MRYPGIISSLLNTGVKTALQDAAGFAQILPLGRGGGRARWSIGHKPQTNCSNPRLLVSPPGPDPMVAQHERRLHAPF